jgi:hypothetical protein
MHGHDEITAQTGAHGSDVRLLAINTYRVAATAGYVALISYMLTEQANHRVEPALVFTVAMTIHLVGVAHAVRQRFGVSYDRVYRFVMAGGAYLGWAIGAAFDVPSTTYALWFSFLAGGVIGLAVTIEIHVVNSTRRLRYFVLGCLLLIGLIVLLESFGELAEL